ncbi:PEP-CTERM sorting domain-containing protein [[Empedobacter] haloabium]|uniref:PEP-CTERM sorting domain-containing protein n=1 Tax=[Empedobacter] haloabium TaxID=592317 RepID=A0ABZ1UNA4_9BURK
MKSVLCAAASVLAFTGTAQAVERTFQFTSTVKQIVSKADVVPDVELSSITLPFGTATIGDAVTATVTYDTSEEAHLADWGGANFRRPLSSFINLGNGAIVRGGEAEGGVIWTHDNDLYPSMGDGFSSYAYFFRNNFSVREMIAVRLEDASGTVLNGYQLPGSELTNFRAGSFTYSYEGYTLDADGYHNFRWDISGDITAIAAVPEPGTYAMLLAGLGLVAWRRKRA